MLSTIGAVCGARVLPTEGCDLGEVSLDGRKQLTSCVEVGTCLLDGVDNAGYETHCALELLQGLSAYGELK